MEKFKVIKEKVAALEILKTAGTINKVNGLLLTELKEILLLTQSVNMPNDKQVLEVAELRTDNRGEQESFLHGAIYIRDVVLGKYK